MIGNPYQKMPDYAFWRRSVAKQPLQSVDPVVSAPFTIAAGDKVATAGSCFAQHIGRFLLRAGLNFLVTEQGHPIAGAELAAGHGYGLFTARYGNIYTSRQLVQLFRRAYGEFQPGEDIWRAQEGFWIDPFRPRIQPVGFESVDEYRADREQHFRAVRRALEELDVLIFTLGLTECWESAADGAVFPLCPGVAGGEFDEERHRFVNLGVEDVVSDLIEVRERIRRVNPRGRMILTVSPVPLVATAENRHVLVSTTYSKAALRVACDRVMREAPDVVYFPAYEIVSGSYNRGRYFADDLRSVTDDGVSHVMRLFLRHFSDRTARADPAGLGEPSSEHQSFLNEMEELVELDCDEELLDLR